MALPSSGPLSIDDIAIEFGGAAPHGLTEYYSADTGVPASGELSITDFYGTQAPPAYYPLYGMTGALWPNIANVPGGGAITINSANANFSAGITAYGWPSNYLMVRADNGQYAFQKMWSWDYRWYISLTSVPVNVRNKKIRVKFSTRTSGATNGTSWNPVITAYTTNATGGRVNLKNFQPSADYQVVDYTTTQTVQQFIDGNSGRFYLGHSCSAGETNAIAGDSASTDVDCYLYFSELELVP
jgi:hypothetical protein